MNFEEKMLVVNMVLKNYKVVVYGVRKFELF